MKKRKIFTTIAAIVLAFGVMSTSAAAATSYCQFMVGDKLCGCPISLRFTGRMALINMEDSLELVPKIVITNITMDITMKNAHKDMSVRFVR